MTLVRFNPARNVFPGIGSFDRLFDSFLDDSIRHDATWMPLIDLSENKEAYELTAELPGMKKDDINISLKDNILTVSGEKKVEKKKEEDTLFRSERVYGKFERVFKLAQEVKADSIKAKYKDGVLSVSIPKDEEKNLPRMISIS